jgi:hypothetical protein
LQDGHLAPVSKVFHWCPQVQIHQAWPSGFQSHFGHSISTDLGILIVFWFKYTNIVPQLNCPTADNTCGYATVATHGAVSAVSKIIFHSGTGIAITSDFEHHFTSNPDLPLYQCQQINTSDDQIAAGKLRIDWVPAHDATNGIEVFFLNERNLPFSTFPAVVVAC